MGGRWIKSPMRVLPECFGIVKIAEGEDADQISVGIGDGISLMGPAGLGGGEAIADGLDGFIGIRAG